MAGSYGSVIRGLREQRAWNQDDLAARAKVSRETVSRAENSGNVGVLYLYRFAHALKVDITAFFGGDEVAREKPPPSVWSRLGKEQRAVSRRSSARWGKRRSGCLSCCSVWWRSWGRCR